MTKKYKVVTTVYSYPNGKLVNFTERFFDTKSDALKYCKENNWENPMQTSKAVAYVFKVKADWFPIN